MARTGGFRSTSKGTQHTITQHPMEVIARRYGYQEYERVVTKQLEREAARRQVPITRQSTRATKSVQRVENLQQRLTQAGKATQTGAQRVMDAKLARAEAVVLSRQAQAYADYQERLSRQTGVPIMDTTYQDRARLAANEASEAQRELRAAKRDFRGAKRRVEALQGRTTRAYAQSAALANSVSVIADWQAAQHEASRLRSRRLLAQWQ